MFSKRYYKQISLLSAGAMAFSVSWASDIIIFTGINVPILFAFVSLFLTFLETSVSRKVIAASTCEVILGILVLWAFVSGLVANVHYVNWSFTYYYALSLIFFSVVRRQAYDVYRWSFIGKSYLAGCLVGALTIIFKWFGIGVLEVGYRLSVGSVNANYIAYSLATAVPVAIANFFNAGQKKVDYFYLVGLFLLYGSAIMLTGSRGGLLAYAAGIFLFSVYVFKSHIFSTIIMMSLFLGGIFALYEKLPYYLKVRLVTLSDVSFDPSGKSDLSGRYEVWPLAVELIKENWFFGVGPGAFPALNPLGIGAHNVFLSVAVELGAFGLILYLLTLYSGFSGFMLVRWSFWGKWVVFIFFVVWLVISSSGAWEVSPVAWITFAWFSRILWIKSSLSDSRPLAKTV